MNNLIRILNIDDVLYFFIKFIFLHLYLTISEIPINFNSKLEY